MIRKNWYCATLIRMISMEIFDPFHIPHLAPFLFELMPLVGFLKKWTCLCPQNLHICPVYPIGYALAQPHLLLICFVCIFQSGPLSWLWQPGRGQSVQRRRRGWRQCDREPPGGTAGRKVQPHHRVRTGKNIALKENSMKTL